MSDNSTSEVTTETQAPIQDTPSEEVAQEPIESQASEPSEPELELVKKEEPQKYFGRFDSIEAAEKSYKEMQAAYQKMKEDLKGAQKAQQDAQLKQLDSMDYDDKVAYLAQQLQSVQEQLSQTAQQNEAVTATIAQEYEQKEISDYVAGNPLLKESGMDDLFLETAMLPQYREYTLESIFNVKFKPKIEKLMGKKIKVKEKPLVGSTKIDEQPKNALDMSRQDYEKNRDKILKNMESEMKAMRAKTI